MWIKHLLDLGDGADCPDPMIKADFYLDLAKRGKKRSTLNISRVVYSGTKKLLCHLKDNIAEIRVDYKNSRVKGAIYEVREEYKETIVGAVFIEPLRFIFARYGLFFLHAAAVAKGRDCVLISGLQNSGKTTLSMILARNGFDFLADDDCFVKFKSNESILFPFPTKIGFSDKLLTTYPELKKDVASNPRWAKKYRISSRNIFSSNGSDKTYACRVILFPKYSNESDVSLKKVSKRDALYRIIGENKDIYYIKGHKELALENFRTLYNLTNKTDSFELLYNDKILSGIPGVVEKILN